MPCNHVGSRGNAYRMTKNYPFKKKGEKDYLIFASQSEHSFNFASITAMSGEVFWASSIPASSAVSAFSRYWRSVKIFWLSCCCWGVVACPLSSCASTCAFCTWNFASARSFDTLERAAGRSAGVLAASNLERMFFRYTST